MADEKAQGGIAHVIGVPGLRQYGGQIFEERLPVLRGPQGMAFYNEMVDNCSTLGAIMFIIDTLVRQVKWTFETQKGYEEDKEAIRWRDWVEGAAGDMSHTFEDMISEVLTFLYCGYAPFELIYKKRKGDKTEDPTEYSKFDDGLWGWRKIEIRAQDTVSEWVFNREDEGLEGFIQNVDSRRAFIPIDKALLFRTRTIKGNPEGRSLLRSAVSDYHYWKRVREIEAIGISRDLAGMVVFEVPQQLLDPKAPAELQAMRKVIETLVSQIQMDERMGAVIPSELNTEGKPTQYKLRLLQSGGTRQTNADPVIRRYEMRMAGSFMAEFMFLGQTNTGTQAMYQGKSNLFGIALGTILDQICVVFTQFAIARLMKLNNVPKEYWPCLSHGDIATPELDKVGTLITAMSTAGLLSPNKKLEAKLLDNAGLPAPDEENDPALDPTVPTPADGEDAGTGLLSERQQNAILAINESIAAGVIDRDAAMEMLGVLLGMDPAETEKFLAKEQEPAEEDAPEEETDDEDEE